MELLSREQLKKELPALVASTVRYSALHYKDIAKYLGVKHHTVVNISRYGASEYLISDDLHQQVSNFVQLWKQGLLVKEYDEYLEEWCVRRVVPREKPPEDNTPKFKIQLTANGPKLRV